MENIDDVVEIGKKRIKAKRVVYPTGMLLALGKILKKLKTFIRSNKKFDWYE